MTVPCVSLVDAIMLAGTADNTAAVQALDILGVTPSFTDWQEQTIATSLSLSAIDSIPLAERLVRLLQQLQQQTAVFSEQQLVYLVLPETTGITDTLINDVLQLVMQQLPQLLMASGCRVFPYGSAGALMALNSAMQYWQQNVNSKQLVWLVGVDSLAHSDVISRFSPTQLQGMLISEGAIALCLAPSGNHCHLMHCVEVNQSGNGQDTAIGPMFTALAKHLNQPLAQLYLPDCGDAEQTERWLEHCSLLSGAIDAQTDIVFPSYLTGELGACGGLYRLWHLFSRLQDGRITGQVAQLEVSIRRYRALTLFGPVGKT